MPVSVAYAVLSLHSFLSHRLCRHAELLFHLSTVTCLLSGSVVFEIDAFCCRFPSTDHLLRLPTLLQSYFDCGLWESPCSARHSCVRSDLVDAYVGRLFSLSYSLNSSMCSSFSPLALGVGWLQPSRTRHLPVDISHSVLTDSASFKQ
jgi:hypothetical protein